MRAEAVGPAAWRTTRWLACAAGLVFVVSGGGRVVGSDEVTMLELSRSLMRATVEVPEGATTVTASGAHVSKNAAGEAVIALPWVALGEGAAAAAGLDPARRALAVRFVASFMNAIVTAVMLGAFHLVARRLGATPGAALAAALMLGFTTPLWVYAKSFMAEPLQGLGLLLVLGGASLAGEPEGDASHTPRIAPEWLAAAGAFLAISVKLSMLPLVLACLVPLRAAPRRWAAPTLGVAAALAGHAVYNLARFGTPFETGYGAQASAAAYSTPLLVGVYGLLLSTGKGALWFAPGLWLLPAGARGAVAPGAGRWWGRAGRTAAGRALVGATCAGAVALLLYGTFQHWAGDGSFGPRYLVPLFPPLFLGVAFALSHAGRARRAFAGALALVGLLVQIGGVTIYFGAQMREAGDYPYARSLEHPRFMSDSHFNPAYSPIAAHWRMLARNVSRHLAGEAPRLSIEGERDPRLGVGGASQRELLSALDFWWLYLDYAGAPRAPVAAALALLLGGTAFAFVRLRGALCAEWDAP